MKRPRSLPHLAARAFGVPLMIHGPRLEVMLSAVGERLGLESVEAVAPFEPKQRAEHEDAPGVAVIPITGPTVHRLDAVQPLSGGFVAYQRIGALLDGALADPGVTAIVLDLDTPGGEVAGCFDLAEKIYQARGRKPIVAVANEAAFSAGYALASAADRVILPRTGGVGSIGVLTVHVDQSQADRLRGLRYTFIHAGAKKVEGNAHEPLKDSVRAEVQGELDRLRGLFVELVARNRGLDAEAVRGTEAGLFHGAAAVEAGLADQVATFEDVIGELAHGAPASRTSDRERAARQRAQVQRRIALEGASPRRGS